MAAENLHNSHSRSPVARSVAEIQQWMIHQLAEELQMDRDKIKVDQPILSYGIDSMQVVAVVAKLEDWIGVRFSTNPLEDHSTIEALSQFVADMAVKKQ